MKEPMALRNFSGGMIDIFLGVLFFTTIVFASSFQQVVEFGENPSNLKMFLYVPDNLPDHAPVLVGIHWCHGTAQNYYTGNKYRYLADEYKFLMIYPSANSSDSCFDVHSKETLTHNGGGDSKSIISMVRYVVRNYSVDTGRIFITGHSSGGMMTNVMAGSYPEVFNAASSSAGVPFACFAGTNTWNSECAEGKINKTAIEWGDLVRNAYPGYDGPRPRMQLWHGSNDNVLRFFNFNEAIEQWTNVLGVDQSHVSTKLDSPLNSYVRSLYYDSTGNVMVDAIRAEGEEHNCRIDETEVIRFFGLDKPSTGRSIRTADRFFLKGMQFRFNRHTRNIIYRIPLTKPGRIRIEMFTLDGRITAAIYDGNNPPGIVTGIWADENTGLKTVLGSTRVICVSINGVVVNSILLPLFIN